MRDSTKLLNFNLDRELNFHAYRNIDIDAERALEFNLNRAISCDLNRDLGFGKRGIIFRGYVCPVCKASIAADAAQCDECGVTFLKNTETTKKKTTTKSKQKTKIKPPVRKAPKQRANKKTIPKTAKKIRDTFMCPICGIPLYVGTASCPGCGLMFSSSAEVRQEIQIPKNTKKNRPGR